MELSAMSRMDMLDARVLVPSPGGMDLAGPVPDMLSREGTSVLVGGHVPLVGGVRWEALVDGDAGERKLLSVGSGLVWNHLCGCFRAGLWVNRRLGREGTDAWIGLTML